MWTALTALFLSSTALAIETEPVLEVSGGGSYWRLGVFGKVLAGKRIPMFEKEGSVLFQDTGLKVLGELNSTPAFARPGARLVFSPLAIMDLHLHGGVDAYFGNFQTVVGYPDASYEYGDNEQIADYREDTGNYGTGMGWHGGAALTLKAKAGPILVLLNGDLTHWSVDAEVDGDWIFEREMELMIARGGDQTLNLNAVLLYELDVDPSDPRKLRFGSLTTKRSSLGAEDELFRTGVLASWFQTEQLSHTLVVQPYLKDRAYDTVMPPFAAYVLKYKVN
jgi:hypothetical protein